MRFILLLIPAAAKGERRVSIFLPNRWRWWWWNDDAGRRRSIDTLPAKRITSPDRPAEAGRYIGGDQNEDRCSRHSSVVSVRRHRPRPGQRARPGAAHARAV